MVGPALLWAALLPMTIYRFLIDPSRGSELFLPVAYVVITAMGYIAAAVWDWFANRPVSWRDWRDLRHAAFAVNAPAWFAAAAVAACVMFVGLHLAHAADAGDLPLVLATSVPSGSSSSGSSTPPSMSASARKRRLPTSIASGLLASARSSFDPCSYAP